MKLKDKNRLIKQWGTHIDPEVCSENYLNHKDSIAVTWSKSHEKELEELDKNTINLYRRHRDNCDFRTTDDVSLMGTQGCERIGGNLPASPEIGWINDMFSRNSEELYQLVSSPKIANAIQSLTVHQRKVVHMSTVEQMKNKEIAQVLNTSDRNVRDILQRAYSNIREGLGNSRGEGTIGSVATILSWILLPTFMIGWEISKRICPKIKQAVIRAMA